MDGLGSLTVTKFGRESRKNNKSKECIPKKDGSRRSDKVGILGMGTTREKDLPRRGTRRVFTEEK